jgi:hypothetical protein
MGRYNGDQVANNTTVTANYRRQIVPFTRFQTRRIIWLSIGELAIKNEDGSVNMAYLNAIIQTIQTQAEIAVVGAPYLGSVHGRMTVGVFLNTFDNGDLTGVNDTDPYNYFTNTASGNQIGSEELLTAIQNAINTPVDFTVSGSQETITVTQVYMYGGFGGNAGQGDTGWSDNPNYREYETVAEFDAQSYLNPTDAP